MIRFLTVLSPLLAVVLAYFIFGVTGGSGGDTGFYARLNSQGTTSVGHQTVVTIFAEDLNCTNRVITSGAQPVYLAFTSDVTPSATNGILHATATTKEYKAEEFGCGAVRGFSPATATISIAEFNF